MKKLSFLILSIILIFNGISSYSFQTKVSFEDINLTPDIEEFIDNSTSRVLFLFGIICVGGCPIGNYIQKIKNDRNVVYVLPLGNTANDIANFKRGLSIKGKIRIATEKNIEFVKLLAQKKEKEGFKWNFILELKDKKIIDMKVY